MANKRAKPGKGKGGAGGGGGGGGGGGSKRPAPQRDDAARDGQQPPPQDLVADVRPYWEALPQEQRASALTLDLGQLRARARELGAKARAAAVEAVGGALGADLSLEASLEEVLEEGLRRLHERGTWKVWQFDGREFTDADAFRAHVQEHRLPPELLRLLPRDDPRAPERPAEAALRQRMTELLARIQGQGRAPEAEEAPAPAPAPPPTTQRQGRRGRQRERQLAADGAAARDASVDVICAVIEAMEQEHPQLYSSVLHPVVGFVCELLGEGVRSTRPESGDLALDDLEKLPADEVARIAEWLTEKVDALSTKTRIDPREEEEDEEDEEAMGDVDLFALTPDSAALTVNAKWLQHLQERTLGDDGHPRKVREAEDPHRMGLVLEWVFGSIVSTAEKGRDGAKRQLGGYTPTADAAFDALVAALEDQAALEARQRAAKELLAEMLRSRQEAAELATRYNTSPAAAAAAAAAASGDASGDGDAAGARSAPAELPDEVIVSMLRREVLLTRAKLHALTWERAQKERELRTLRTQIKAGEPELERLKRELEELKHQPRGLEGSYRTQAEMERHRHQLADAAIEEQLEVQTAFREQGAKLQGLYERKQRTEYDVVKRENELKQLNGWKATVDSLVERLGDLLQQRAALAPDAAAEAAAVAAVAAGGEGQDLEAGEGDGRAALQAASIQVNLSKMRSHFLRDVHKQLYNDADDRGFATRIAAELKELDRRIEEGRAALVHLDAALSNVACDDPGTAIGSQLALPLLQERLAARAAETRAERARLAEVEIIEMEREAAEREAAEREKKAKARQKKASKGRTEKERLAAERAEREAAERERAEAEAAARRARDEEDRRRRAEEVERLRREEEEAMERRRKELMTDGYWAQRIAEEEQQALFEQLLKASDEDAAAADGGAGREEEDGFLSNERRRRRRNEASGSGGGGSGDGAAAPAAAPRPRGAPREQRGPGCGCWCSCRRSCRRAPRSGAAGPARPGADQRRHRAGRAGGEARWRRGARSGSPGCGRTCRRARSCARSRAGCARARCARARSSSASGAATAAAAAGRAAASAAAAAAPAGTGGAAGGLFAARRLPPTSSRAGRAAASGRGSGAAAGARSGSRAGLAVAGAV